MFVHLKVPDIYLPVSYSKVKDTYLRFFIRFIYFFRRNIRAYCTMATYASDGNRYQCSKNRYTNTIFFKNSIISVVRPIICCVGIRERFWILFYTKALLVFVFTFDWCPTRNLRCWKAASVSVLGIYRVLFTLISNSKLAPLR